MVALAGLALARVLGWALGLGEAGAGVGAHVDLHLHRQAGPQGAGDGRLGIDGDLHGQALGDLGEVAHGVLHRDQGELRAGGRGEESTWPLISCLPKASAWMVTGWPTRRPGDLGLLEVGDHIGLAQRHDAHQGRAGAHILAGTHGASAHHARRPGP